VLGRERKDRRPGVHLSRWVSKHGLAFEREYGPRPFQPDQPLRDGAAATSISKILNRELPMEDIEGRMLDVSGSLRDEPGGDPTQELEALPVKTSLAAAEIARSEISSQDASCSGPTG